MVHIPINQNNLDLSCENSEINTIPSSNELGDYNEMIHHFSTDNTYPEHLQFYISNT